MRLERETLATLTEWQGQTLRRAGYKPTYGQLLDLAIRHLSRAQIDIVEELAQEAM